MPTILQINSTLNWGSTGRIAEQVGLVAQQCGWNSYVAYGRMANRSKLQTIRIGNRFEVFFHGILTRLFDAQGLGSRHATKRLLKQIDSIRPDIIHLHNIHGYYLNYQILFDYIVQRNIKVVWTLHDCWPFTGHCTYFEQNNCYKWRTECKNCHHNLDYPRSFTDCSARNFRYKRHSFTLPRNITLVPVSQWLAEYVSQSFLKEQVCLTIHNGVDTQIFKPLKVEHQSVFTVLGVASRWSKRKGLDDFVKLSLALPEDCRIVLIGVEPQQAKRLPPQIVWLERTDSVDQLVELYNRADVFVNPTYDDNFPATNIEALACGTPIVTYRTGGCPEAVDKTTGIVVEQGDIATLAASIETVKTRGKAFYTDFCRRKALDCFDSRRQFGKYIELYEQIMNK